MQPCSGAVNMDKHRSDSNFNHLKAERLLGERIYVLRKSRKLSQRQLAKMVSVSHVTVSQWESSDSQPRGVSLVALGMALRCSPAYLLYGGENDDDVPEQLGAPYTAYPVLNNLQACTWQGAVCTTWLASDAQLAGDGFWLRIDNNAMTSLSGLSVTERSLVLFDTGRESVAGDLILVIPQGRHEPTFRQLVHDSGVRYLRALNPKWPVHLFDRDDKMIGVAIESRMSLTHREKPQRQAVP